MQENKKSFGLLLGMGKKRKKKREACKLLPSCGVRPSPEHRTAVWVKSPVELLLLEENTPVTPVFILQAQSSQ